MPREWDEISARVPPQFSRPGIDSRCISIRKKLPMPPQQPNPIEHPVDAPLTGNFDWIKDPNLWGERLVIPEWEDATYRSKNGWQGSDLVHSGT